ncbi:hypothetical protein HYC85_001375 [Camellia sinensis]|uniref:DNA/RNA-binding protein Kin17 WH-like domain-containing protein n=1 Tax=Camellia sinensis TaxID=4442 RepID=A0A7J7I6P6_CAMSI|nr:hypothetical protein HYC85_001375 [Camellia sinensis]
MGKSEFLTPKAIANRIKAKGLQKLRWYYQMCQKQCRDENGFKCHCMSESHQRQMEVFGQNPHRIVDGYSEEFEREFLDQIKCSHCFSRIATTVVYNEYIADRHHIHMNSTQWATLTEFVKYLGRTGKCKVDEEKQEREIRRQIGRAENGAALPLEFELKPLEKSETGEKIVLSLSSLSKLIAKEKVGSSKLAKERINRKDYWLCEGIIVKVMSKALAEKGYYKQKQVVRKLIDKYVGEIEMFETKHVLRVDQEELETVIPQIGGIVRIVNGAYRGSNARLLAVDTDKFCAKVQIEKGIYDGRVIQAVDYEDICKVFSNRDSNRELKCSYTESRIESNREL